MEKYDSHVEFQINPDFMMRNIAGEYVIVPMGTQSEFSNTVMSANESAAAIWQIFQKPHTVDYAVEKLLEEFEGSEEQVREDVHAFIVDTFKYGILKRR